MTCRRVFVGVAALVLTASANALCPTLTSTAVDVLADTPLQPMIKASSAATTALTCTPGVQRLDITSIKVVETSGANIDVDVAYQQDDTIQSVVQSVTGASCYEFIGADVTFTLKAPGNPAKINPLVTITCPTGTCNVQHEILGNCVDLSPSCPVIAADAVTVTAGAIKTLTRASFVATSAGAKLTTACTSDQRLEISAVKVVETSGANLDVNVKYRTTDVNNRNPVAVKSASEVACSSLSGTETSFATQADANPLQADAIVEVSCLSATADCMVKYDIVAACVTKSPYPVMVSSITVPKTVGITVGAAIIPVTQVVDVQGVAILSCPANTRLDILSAAFLETSGVSIGADVSYQSYNIDPLKIQSVSVKTFTPAAKSFLSVVVPSELSFSSFADSHPDKITPVLTLSCPGTLVNCVVKFKVVGMCVLTSTKCPALPVTGVSVPANVPLRPMVKAISTATTPLTCDASAQRLDITSVKIIETAGANINVDLAYQQTDAIKSVIKSVTNVDCFDFGEVDVSFATRAAANPAKVTPVITVTCVTGTCNVQHEVIGKCVPLSPSCPTIAALGASVPKASTKTFSFSDFVSVSAGAKLATACTSDQRLEISAVKVVETSGANLDVSVKYRTMDVNNRNPVEIKRVSGVACSSLSGTETSFATQADANPLQADAIVEVSCLSATADCMVKYDIVAACVTKSPYPVMVSSITVPKTVGITVGAAIIPVTQVVDVQGVAILSCPANTRLDILSAAFLETSGVSIGADVSYQSYNIDPLKIQSVSVKTFTPAAKSFLSVVVPSELSFSSFADSHPDKITPVLTLSCPGTLVNCVVKFKVVGMCVLTSTKCPALPVTGVSVPANVPLRPMVKAISTATTPLTCDASAQRLDITSVKIIETAGANINVDLAYQQTDAIKSVIKSVTNVDCFDFGEVDVSFATRAAANPAKVTPVITVTCVTGTCNVQHEVIGKCVPLSPSCPTTSITDIVSFAKATTKTFTITDFVATADSTVHMFGPSCAAGTRLDISSVTIVETSGANLDVSVKYRTKDSTKYNPFTIKSVSEVACYSSSGTETSLSPQADLNPLRVDAYVDVKCLSTTTACTVKYEIVAQCLDISTTCANPPAGGDTILVGKSKTIPLTEFKNAANTANTLAVCVDPTYRLEVNSLAVVETNGASITVNVGYQMDATHQTSVMAFSNIACYMSVTDELRFTNLADYNPTMLTPYVTIQCPATNAASCAVKYEVQAECVAQSTTCVGLTAAPVAIAKGSFLPIVSFLSSDKIKPLSCDARRTDIQSVKISEVNGNKITVDVKYEKDATAVYVAQSITNATCYESASTAEVSFGAMADVDWDFTSTVVNVACASSNVIDCSIKYEIVGTCVDRSPTCPTMPATAISVPTLNAADGKLVVPLTDFKAVASAADAMATCSDTQRVDIKSFKIFETNGAKIQVNLGYQDAATTPIQVPVITIPSTGITCYQSTTPADTKFGYRSNVNSDKITPFIEITCLGSAACVLQYEVVGECVDLSVYPIMIKSITVPRTVGDRVGTIPIPLNTVVDTRGIAIASCPSNTRLDILSAAFAETSGVAFNANFKYQSSTRAVVVKDYPMNAASFQSSITASELSFAGLANSHPDKITPVITLNCPSTAADCVVKYNVVGKCVPISTKCTAVVPATVVIPAVSYIHPIIKANTAATTALICDPTTQRLDITSMKIVETTGGNVNVDLVYQQSDTIKSVIKSVTGIACFDYGEADVSFASRAAMSPGKVTPLVTITCPVGADCNVKHDIIGRCVPLSTACPVISDSTVVAMTVAAGATKTFTRVNFVAAAGSGTNMGSDCAPDQRLDITSVKIVETTGANLDVSIKYRTMDASNSLPVKNLLGVACYTSSGAETSYTSSQADLNPLLLDGVVDVKCLSASSCSIKYEIVAQCVPKSSRCSTVTLPSGHDTITAGGLDKVFAPSEFMDATTPANSLSCDTNHRLEIKSMRVVETNGANIIVNVGYQNNAMRQSVITTFSNIACYTSAPNELRFKSGADANPSMNMPYITIKCPPAISGCVLKYEVLTECVDLSTKCASLTSSTTIAPQPIRVGSVLEIAPTQFVDTTSAKAALVCTADQRADIQSIKMEEVNGNMISVMAVYRKDDANSNSVRTITGVSCYESSDPSEVSLGVMADDFWDYTSTVVAVECLSTNTADCSIKYEIVGACVPISPPCPTMPATSIGVPTLAASAKLVLPTANFMAVDGTTALSSCADPTERLDITSVKIFESTGAKVNVDIGYQKDASNQLAVVSLTKITCYQPTSLTVTRFGSSANANTDKVYPYVEVTCLGTTGCAFKYEILTECVAKSSYPALPNSITVPMSTGATPGTAVIPLAVAVDTTGVVIPSCPAGSRLDVLAAAFAETSAAAITADVKYQSFSTDLTRIKAITVKTFATAATSAFLSSITASELSFAGLANSHPDKITPVITLNCPSTAADCVVKYNVVGKCVPISTKCTAVVPATVVIPAVSYIHPIIKANTAATTALICDPTTQRLDITSMKIVETTGGNVNVDLVYQQSDTIKSVIKSVTGIACFDYGEADVSFASRAAMSPGKVTPLVTITCPVGADCNVKHDIIGRCVPLSTACPVISDSTVVAMTVAAGATKTFTRADFVAMSGSATKLSGDCSTTHRLDITAVRIVETSGVNVNVNVRYRTKDTSNSLSVKSVSEVACYSSSGSETSIATQADLNPLLLDGVVDVKCLSASSCSIKYDIVAQCVMKSAACLTQPATGDTVITGSAKTLAMTEFKDATAPANSLTCDASNRLEIKSLRVVETNGANFVVNVGYQKDDTHQSVVKTFSNIACYASAPDELRFTSRADANPLMITPFVTIQCPAANAASCNLKYEVLVECVPVSTKCASLTMTPQMIVVGTTMEIVSTHFVDTTAAKAALTCDVTQRADIQSVKIAEVSGNKLNATVKYQKDATNLAVVKSTAGVTCYQSSSTMELSFASAAVANWDYTNAIVAVECVSSNAGNCFVQYEVVGSCVQKTCPTMPATSIAVPALAATTKLVLPSVNFKAPDGTTVLSSCADPTKRLDIISVKVSETSGATVKVDVGYQKDASSQLAVASVASGVCFQAASAGTKLGFRADGNSDKTTPYVEVTCLAVTGSCVLKYEVLVECVAKSLFPAMVSTSTVTVTKSTVTSTVPSTIPLTGIVDAKGVMVPTCVAGTRLDILSAAFFETSGASINANVKYQSVNADATKVKSVVVKTFTPSDAYSYASTATELSFAKLADSHPDKVIPVLTLTCTSITTDCIARYNVVGKCVPISTKCPAVATAAVIIPAATFINPMIKANTAATTALICDPTTQRLDITSMKIMETTGTNINVDLAYQQTDAIKSVIKSATNVDCFDFGEADVSFASRAALNPGKVTPLVTITCPVGADCSVKHDIIGKCVPLSTVCPIIPDSTVIAMTVAAGVTKTFTRTDFAEKSAGAKLTAACTADQRLDITSVKIVETSGANLDVSVKYRTKDVNNLNAVAVKSISEVACYTSTGTETSYTTQADANPLRVDAVVDVKCLSATVPCFVKYDIVAQCMAKSSSCATAPAGGDTIAAGASKTIALADFKDAAAPTNVLSSCADTTKRLEIKSLTVVETNGASVKVAVGYQKDDTHQQSVKIVGGIACYTSVADELRFTSAKADANPFKLTPYVTIQCLSATTACVLKYEVQAECVAASTKCAGLASATAQSITLGSTVEILPAKFVDTTKVALACTSAQRADIQSVKVLEVNGNSIGAVVKYQKDATNLVVVKNITDVSCYQSTGTTELSFGANALSLFEYTTTTVVLKCAPSNGNDCSVKYEIVGSCVTKSTAQTTALTPAPTTASKATELADSAASAMEYYTRVITMVVSIAAGGYMMYIRH